MNRPSPAQESRPAVWLAATSTLAYVLSRFLAVSPYGRLGNLEDGYLQALHLAFRQHWQFGRDIVFTYGPWGFLYGGDEPGTRAAATAAWLLLAVVFWAAGWRVARACSPRLLVSWLWLAAFTAIAGVEIVANIDARLGAGIVLLWALHFFIEDRPLSRVQAALVATLGLIALVKFALLIPAAAVILVIAADTLLRHRRFPWILPLFAASVAAWWLAAGQSLGTFGAYLRTSAELTGGFAEAMGVDAPGEARAVGGFLLGALAVLLLGGWAGWRQGRRRGVLALAALGVPVFAAFKYGYVRHDVHELAAVQELALLALACLAIRPPGAGRAWTAGAAATAAGILLLTGATFARHDPAGLAGEIGRSLQPGTLAAPFRAAFAPEARQREFEEYRAALRIGFPLPRLTGAADIYPWDIGALLANGLSYRPRPVLQSYTAYTPGLAGIDAGSLRGSRAPDQILFAPGTLDGRFPSLDDGLSWPELLTRYDLRAVEQPFLVLARSPTPRPWGLTPLADRTADFGNAVPLPPAAAGPLWARIEVEPSAWGRLLAFFYKPPPIILSAVMADGTSNSWRLVPGFARAGFLLSPVIKDTGEFAALATGLDRPGLPGREPVALRLTVAGARGAEAAYLSCWRLRLDRLDFPRQDPDAVPGFRALRDLARATAGAKLLRAGGPVQLAYLADTGTVLESPPATALLLAVPPGATRLTIGFGIAGAPPSGPVNFRVSALRPPADVQTMWSRTLDPPAEPGDRGPRQAAIDLSFWPNAQLIFETQSADSKAGTIPAYWSEISFR